MNQGQREDRREIRTPVSNWSEAVVAERGQNQQDLLIGRMRGVRKDWRADPEI